MLKTRDLVLDKLRFEDWEDMYRNVWSRAETARYMLWQVTTSEEAARERMERTVNFQRERDAWTVYLGGRAIGFAGMMEVEPGVYEDTGVALGPDYVGRGLGKQVLTALTGFAFERRGARRFIASCREENVASRRLILSCGFSFTHREDRTDPRDGRPYVLEFYRLDSPSAGGK